MLVNLIQNAIKFSQKDQIVYCQVEMNQEQPSLVSLDFKVIDTGLGISDDD